MKLRPDAVPIKVVAGDEVMFRYLWSSREPLSMNADVRTLVIAFALFIAPQATLAEDDVQSIWVTKSGTVEPTRLPLGDKRYSDKPKKGYVYACNPKSYSGTIGAHAVGPWIHGSTWDATKKLSVQGKIYWPEAFYSMSVTEDSRVFSGNELPVNEPTGIFPIRRSDPAYAIDTNPNTIQAQSTTFAVPLNPTIAAEPSCVSIAIVGIALNGVSFYRRS